MDERKFEDALHGLGGPPVDPYAALDQMRPRLVGAGRRRAAARAGWLAAAAALLIGVGVAIALSNGGRGRVQLDTSDNGHLVTSTTTDASSIIITASPAATTAPAGIETGPAATTVAPANGRPYHVR